MASKKASPALKKAEEKLPEQTAILDTELNETPQIETVPDPTDTQKELPKDFNEAHAVTLDGETREIKSTKVKYHRNRTAVAYRILQVYPLPDVLAMDAGILDPDRDGDQILFDFLIAAFDDADFVKRHYDNMTAEDVEKVVKIFCEVNGITEKEEQAKNRQAKGTKA